MKNSRRQKTRPRLAGPRPVDSGGASDDEAAPLAGDSKLGEDQPNDDTSPAAAAAAATTTTTTAAGATDATSDATSTATHPPLLGPAAVANLALPAAAISAYVFPGPPQQPTTPPAWELVAVAPQATRDAELSRRWDREKAELPVSPSLSTTTAKLPVYALLELIAAFRARGVSCREMAAVIGRLEKGWEDGWGGGLQLRVLLTKRIPPLDQWHESDSDCRSGGRAARARPRCAH